MLLSGTLSPGRPSRVFDSPDHALRALVFENDARESLVKVETASGQVLAIQDSRSKDGQHGLVVEHAAWTADSHFFVVGKQSSGGHQPWTHPISVYAREKHRMLDLETKRIVVTSDFTLEKPDVIHMTVLDPCAKNGASKAFDLKLSDLLKDGLLAALSCP